MPISNPPPTPTVSTYGNFTGDSSVNKAIAHGLGSVPSLVIIWPDDSDFFYRIIRGHAFILRVGTTQGNFAVTGQTDTNFYVGNATNYEQSANYTGKVYYYVAIS